MRPTQPTASGTAAFETVHYVFIFTALGSLALAVSLLAARPRWITQYFYFSTMLSLTHLVTLGFVTSLMMGVLYRLAPLGLSITPRSRRMATMQCALFVIGASGMVFHFWIAEYSGMAWATTFVWLATVIQLWNFSRLFSPDKLRQPARAFVAAGMIYLVVAASIGVALGFQKIGVTLPFADLSLLDRLSVHIHLALVGWILHCIIGFQTRLLPSTAGGVVGQWVRFLMLQIGLGGLTASLLFDLPYRGWFAMLIALVVIGHTVGPVRLLVRKRFWEWELIPSAFALVAAGLGAGLAWGIPDEPESRAAFQAAYVYAGLFGYVVLTIIITVFKLFPMWVWKGRFAKEFGRRPVPGMKALADHRLMVGHHLLLALGIGGTVVSLLAQSESWMAAFLGIQWVGVVLFLSNFVRVARWRFLSTLTYEPQESDWQKFREMFPAMDARSGGATTPQRRQ